MRKLSIHTILFLFSGSATSIIIEYAKSIGVSRILNSFFHHSQLMDRVYSDLERKRGIA